MIPLVLAIRLYRKFTLVKRVIQAGIAIHHKIRKPQTRPCPHATASSGCSGYFESEARKGGQLTVLRSILTAMAVCGPAVIGADESLHCRPKASTGLDSMEWCISAQAGGCFNDGKSNCIAVMPQRGGWWPEQCK